MVSPWISLLALALGTTCSLADSPSVAQQLAAGVSKPLDLSNVTADYFNEAQPVIARNGPSQPIPLSLRQATRAQILSAVRRKDQRLYRKQVRGSDKPATCVPDSEPPKSGVKAAVFSDIATSDNGVVSEMSTGLVVSDHQELGEEPSSEIGACAQFCESFSSEPSVLDKF